MIKFNDAVSVGAVKTTKEGYTVATCKVARTGVQLYRAAELGDAAAHLPPDSVQRVYRAPDSVFSADAIASLTRIPVTLNHPPEMVTADNWSEYAIGEVGDRVAQDGDWLVVNPMIKDAAGAAAAKTTHKEISLGYTAEVVPARDGVDANFEQVNIQVNHLAIVPRGRAGSQARFGDAQTWGAAPVTVEDKRMTIEVKTVVLGDKAVEVVSKDADTVAAILKDHKLALDAKDVEIGELTAKLADAEAKVLTEDALAALVAAKVESDTKRAAVKAKLGDAADNMTDAQIEGAYLVVEKMPSRSAAAKAIADGVVETKDADALIQDAINKRFNKEAK